MSNTVLFGVSRLLTLQLYVSFLSDNHRKIPRIKRPRSRTTPAMTRTNLRTPTKRRVLSRTAAKSLILAKAVPSRAATVRTVLDLDPAREEKVVDPSPMGTVLRRAKEDPREDPRPEIAARVALESSKL